MVIEGRQQLARQFFVFSPRFVIFFEGETGGQFLQFRIAATSLLSFFGQGGFPGLFGLASAFLLLLPCFFLLFL